jgi:hypothetical protein
MVLLLVALGSIEYSAVIQPLLVPFKKGGTFSSMVAVVTTLVLPVSIKADPSAYLIKSGEIFVGLISSKLRLLALISFLPDFLIHELSG